MIPLVLVWAAFSLFIIYNAVSIGILGIPRSMSKTYYLYEEIDKGLGWLFTAFMWLMGLILIPGWIAISMSIGPWESYLTFLAFICGGCILFVGTAPKYLISGENEVHMTAAKICAVAALLWCFIACWRICYVTIIGMSIPAIIGLCTKSWGSARDYWLEMMAFDGTFLTIIVAGILW